jgi:calcineurin-like phosphoesterase family protein
MKTKNSVWFISDTHFGHDNILKFNIGETDQKMRPDFHDTRHMDEIMIENWNRVVKPQDKIYHLGDVCFSQQVLDEVMPRLNGKKRLVLGNHDNLPMTSYMKYFQEISSWAQFKRNDVGLYCCHFPLHSSAYEMRAGDHTIRANVHGHIHCDVINDPRYINVCVEQTNYTPVHIDTLIARAKKI